MPENIWIVGNSQLHQSLLAEYCTQENYLKYADDWKNQQISSGNFIANDQKFNFLFCNMTLLGDLSFDGNNVHHTSQMANFAKLIDKDATIILVMLRGNEFAFESLVETKVPWDFSYGETAALKGRQLVKRNDALIHLEKATNALLATCILYKISFPQAAVYHIVAPPPIESDKHILDNPEGFSLLFEKFGLRPFSVRKKIYDAMYENLSTRLLRYGVETLEAPAEALNESGGLRSDFASGCLHGNKNYGRAIISLLEKRNLYASL